jgi:protein-tyrosine kinase
MGKIFKALEKAEKQSAAEPNRKPQAPQRRLDPMPSDSPAQEQAADRLVRRPSVAERESQPVEPVQLPIRQQPVPQPERSTDAGEPPLTADPAAALSETGTAHRVEKALREVNAHADFKSTGVPIVPGSAVAAEPNRKTEVTPIARLKPEDPERSFPPRTVPEKPKVVEKVEGISETGKTISKPDVRVRYSRTKVQVNDPVKLKNNKVLSAFEDIETSNQFKMLRTQVLKKLKASGGNSILVTSANPYEGKTFTSINLGVSIAKEFDRTVLIIDADIRRPTRQHTDFSTEFFSLKVDKGLTDYLEGDADIEDILINPGIDKLTLIPGGMPVDNSPELLNSTRMEEMMVEIKSRYPADRLVIVDGPALLHFPDAMLLFRYVDGVLPVVEAERTSTEDLKKMMNHLKDANILGVVLNKNRQ